MRIGYFIRNIGVSGGVKVILQHVKMLRDEGYDVLLMTQNVKTDWDGFLPVGPALIEKHDLSDMPDCDVYVGSVPTDVTRLYNRHKGKTVHLCQGYEPVEFRARLTGETVTEKYARRGVLSLFQTHADRAKFKKRIREIEAVYALPTIKAAVSAHLKELIEKTYGQKCALIQNGIDGAVFYPDRTRTWGKDGMIRILSTGSMAVGFKGIPDTLDAVAILKSEGMNIELTRVSPGPPSEREKHDGLVDRYLSGIGEQEMAALYRETDIFISSSLEGEGFGLPAIEALASGVPSILTEISTYGNFNADRTYAWFVPTHSPERIAEGVAAFVKEPSLRDSCVEKGFAVAKKYSLERTKQDLLDFLKRLS